MTSSNTPEVGRVALLLAALALGVAAAAAAMPAVFRWVPTDTARIGVVLEALRQREPRVVVFGNSMVMEALDARRLGRALPGRPPALNLATPGQTLVESFLLHQELPDSVERVVQMLTVAPPGSESVLDASKYNAFYLNGFRPTDATRSTLEAVYGEAVGSLLDRSDPAQRFEGRWVVRQLADTGLRRLLRPDLRLADAESDLVHPRRYTKPVAPPRLERMLDAAIDYLANGPPEVSSEKLALSAAMLDAARRRGIRLAFLFPPVHPEVRRAAGGAHGRAIEAFRARFEWHADVAVIDTHDALAPDRFIDSLHATQEGAEIVTDLLARGLADAR